MRPVCLELSCYVTNQHFGHCVQQRLRSAQSDLSRVIRKPDICTCKNKDAYQLRSNCAADQRLCFCYTDRTIPLLCNPQISSLYPSSVAVQPGLCRTWLEYPKTRFPTSWLIYLPVLMKKAKVLSFPLSRQGRL